MFKTKFIKFTIQNKIKLHGNRKFDQKRKLLIKSTQLFFGGLKIGELLGWDERRLRPGLYALDQMTCMQ